MRDICRRTFEIAVVAIFGAFSVGGFTSSEESPVAPPLEEVAPVVSPLPEATGNTAASSPTMVALDTVLALVTQIMVYPGT